MFGGERGIRTLGTLLTYTRFPIVLFRPLRHLSKVSAYRIIAYRGETDKQNEAKNQKSPDQRHMQRRALPLLLISLLRQRPLSPLLLGEKYTPSLIRPYDMSPPHLSRRDGCLAFQGRNRLQESSCGVLAGGCGYVRVPERCDL